MFIYEIVMLYVKMDLNVFDLFGEIKSIKDVCKKDLLKTSLSPWTYVLKFIFLGVDVKGQVGKVGGLARQEGCQGVLA